MKSYRHFVINGNRINHRPPFKVLINKILRFFQRGEMKWVIYSKCQKRGANTYYCYGYGFGPVKHLKGYK